MYKNILVPVALDSETGASAALKVAKELLNASGTITLLHVIEEYQGCAAMPLPKSIAEEHFAYAKSALDKAAKDAGGAVHAKVVDGHAARTILNEAEAMGADCIVVASHRPGLEDYFIGSTAAHVVRHAGCSVHVVR